MRIAATLLAAVLVAPIPGPAAASTRAITATGPLAVLNGVALVDLQAVAPTPLGFPAPSGHLTITWQSTFQPPGPRVETIVLWCTAVVSDQTGVSFTASGYDTGDRPWYVRLRTGELLWELGASMTATSGQCGAGGVSTHPLIGIAAITP